MVRTPIGLRSGVLSLVLTACSGHPKGADAGTNAPRYFLLPPTPICDAAADADFFVALEADARPRDCTATANVSFRGDVHPIFLAKCSGEVCHNDTWASPSAYSLLVRRRASECCDGRQLIAPGNPEGSYLVQKLLDVDLCAGGAMPAAGSISQSEISVIENWVCEGAPND